MITNISHINIIPNIKLCLLDINSMYTNDDVNMQVVVSSLVHLRNSIIHHVGITKCRNVKRVSL